LSTTEEVEALMESIGYPETDDYVCECGGPVLTAEHDFSGVDSAYKVAWSSGHDTPAEYALYGWVKQSNLVVGTDE